MRQSTPYTPYYPPPPPAPRKPTRKSSHALRDLGLILLALVIAASTISIGYAVAHGISIALPSGLPFVQSTPVATLTPLDALTHIKTKYPQAQVRVSSSLSNEIDLLTIVSAGPAVDLSPTFATSILSLYLRGYGGQTFWRWVDANNTSHVTTLYEVHGASNELWVIAIPLLSCNVTWTIYTIPSAQIVQRGASGGNYASGINARAGGTPLPGEVHDISSC